MPRDHNKTHIVLAPLVPGGNGQKLRLVMQAAPWDAAAPYWHASGASERQTLHADHGVWQGIEDETDLPAFNPLEATQRVPLHAWQWVARHDSNGMELVNYVAELELGRLPDATDRGHRQAEEGVGGKSRVHVILESQGGASASLALSLGATRPLLAPLDHGANPT